MRWAAKGKWGFRAIAVSLALVLTSGGSVSGAYRALLSNNRAPIPFEEHEQRSLDQELKSNVILRRAGVRAVSPHPVPSLATRVAGPKCRPAFNPPPDLPHSAHDLRNGIGAPLRC